MDKYTPAEIAFAKELATRKIALDLELIQNPPSNGFARSIIQVPITKIDDIQVRVNLRFIVNTTTHKENCLFLEIENMLIENLFCQNFRLTKETAYEDSRKILKVIKSLKFQKTTHYLKCGDCNCDCEMCKGKSHLKPETWIDLFDDCENIKMRWDICCVCHELTNSVLRDCKHAICLPCADKLEVDDDIGAITCPICRDTCSIHPTDEGEHTLIRR
jgi:hypothetical protein